MTLGRFDPPLPVLLLVAVLAGLAAYVRLSGTWWDGLASLHPDERHLLFVTFDLFRALDDPAHAGLSLGDWWFSDGSPLNPRAQGGSFVYGEAPLLAVMLLARWTGTGGWPEVLELGRMTSALVDTTTVVATFLAARQVAGHWIALVAATLYAAMPTALQLANFHTVDVWLTAASGWALVGLVALARASATRRGLLASAGSAGAFAGLAVACKVTGLLLLPAALVALGLARRNGLSWGRVAGAGMLGLAAALVVFRLANPFAFTGPGPFGVALSERWMADLLQLADITASPDFPPNWQWMAGYGPWRFLRDFAAFGAGPAAAALLLLLLLRRRRDPVLLVPLALAAAVLLVTAASTVAALRYGAPALPALALLAAASLRGLGPRTVLPPLLLALWWASGAVRLHDGQHPRLVASLWLWEQPRGTVLVNETSWDEGLPVPVLVDPSAPPRWADWEGWFGFADLDIVAPDSPEKADRIAERIAGGDFVILSSDRQSGVMPRLPGRFPLTTEHYRLLRSGEWCLVPAFRVDRGYPLWGLRIDDSWVQEPWRVYDHPIVEIHRREACFDAAVYAARLKAALPAGP